MRSLMAAMVLMLFGTSAAFAEQLLVNRIEQIQAQAEQRPSRGLVMETVKERYGAPERIVPAIGEPPITRWVYTDFTVYFERDRVIHSVTRR
jgi:hypothetical protein